MPRKLRTPTDDHLVLRLDRLLERIAALRDEAAEIGSEKYHQAKWALEENSAHVVLTQLQKTARIDPGAKVRANELAVLTTAGAEIRGAQDALVRRRQLGELVDRVHAAFVPAPPAPLTTVTAKRERFLELLRFWAGQTRLLSEGEGRELAVVAEEEARDFAAAVDTFWPSVAKRLREHHGKLAAYLVAAQPGRPKKRARYAERTVTLLPELLEAVGFGSIDTHKTKRRRARGRASKPR